MRTITPELEALIRARFQAAGSGYSGRCEVDFVETATVGGGDPDVHLADWTTATSYGKSVSSIQNTGSPSTPLSYATDGDHLSTTYFGDGVFGTGDYYRGWVVDLGAPLLVSKVSWAGHWGTTTVEGTPSLWAGDTLGALVEVANVRTDDDLDGWAAADVIGGAHTFTLDTPTIAQYWWVREDFTISGIQYHQNMHCEGILINGVAAESEVTTIEPMQLHPIRIAINRNLRMGPDQADVSFVNEDLALGFGPTSIFRSNSRIRTYQWFGDPANEVLTFTGVIDKVGDHRDPLALTLTCRSMAGPILVDQTFATTAPQGADEAGTLRTEANGVYLAREVDYIVADRLDRAGWPAALIDIADTSFVLDEFLVDDGATEWDTLARLAAFVGYTLWDDEDGWIHFRTIGSLAAVDTTLAADYEYEIGAA